MQECGRMEDIVRAWEETGSVAHADLAVLQEHCRTCSTCRRLHGPLLVLLASDAAQAGSAEGPAPAAAPTPPGFTDSVMQRIGGRAPRRRLSAPAWAAVAAACVLLAAGIGVFATRAAGAAGSNEVVVRFELAAPGARSVTLVGSFNDWNTTKLRMSDHDKDGVWQIDVRLPRDSVNTYNFVIDGKTWVPDPRASAQVDDGFGGYSSVLRL